MTEFYINSQKIDDPDEFLRIMNEMQEEIVAEIDRVQQEFDVRDDTANAIVYLRSRSRWTHSKELELIERDHAGCPIPLNRVLSGEF
jgi:hypothetical protein